MTKNMFIMCRECESEETAVYRKWLVNNNSNTEGKTMVGYDEGMIEDEIEMVWHNYVDGLAPLTTQLEEAQYMEKQIKGLIQLEKQGIMKIVDCDSSPSLIRCDILDREEYDRRRREFGLPRRRRSKV